MKQQNCSEQRGLQVGDYAVFFGQMLGRGATGTVYRGQHVYTHKDVAVKVIDLATINDDATRLLLENQKNALRTVKDANVVELHEIAQKDGKCYIITELCEGQTLSQLIAKRGRLSEEEAMKIFRKILAGGQAITQNCIIHRDLKPANIIVSPLLEPKIIDFGFCEVIMAKKVMRTFNVGSPSYMAPQAYLRTLYSQKSDSWSLGMILFEMLQGRTLDEGRNISEYFEHIKNNPSFVTQYISEYSGNVRQILEKSLKYQPEERMSISGMKYLTDVYSLRSRRQSNTSAHSQTSSTSSNSIPSTQNIPTRTQPSYTLQNILGETVNIPLEGFASYGNFSKPPTINTRINKASQISVTSSSHKNSSVQRSIGEHHNQNFQFLANKIIGVPDFYQCLSTKNVEHKIRGPPVFRQVTVRYL